MKLNNPGYFTLILFIACAAIGFFGQAFIRFGQDFSQQLQNSGILLV